MADCYSDVSFGGAGNESRFFAMLEKDSFIRTTKGVDINFLWKGAPNLFRNLASGSAIPADLQLASTASS